MRCSYTQGKTGLELSYNKNPSLFYAPANIWYLVIQSILYFLMENYQGKGVTCLKIFIKTQILFLIYCVFFFPLHANVHTKTIKRNTFF